ncbi:unnamed protein product [Ectocarpus sp. 12 AP-2014]
MAATSGSTCSSLADKGGGGSKGFFLGLPRPFLAGVAAGVVAAAASSGTLPLPTSDCCCAWPVACASSSKLEGALRTPAPSAATWSPSKLALPLLPGSRRDGAAPFSLTMVGLGVRAREEGLN